MPKMKRHKGLVKRIKVTAKRKIGYKKSFAGHLMSGKGGGRSRQLRRPGILSNKPLRSRILRAVQA